MMRPEVVYCPDRHYQCTIYGLGMPITQNRPFLHASCKDGVPGQFNHYHYHIVIDENARCTVPLHHPDDGGREWHGITKPALVTGMGHHGYGCGYSMRYPQVYLCHCLHGGGLRN